MQTEGSPVEQIVTLKKKRFRNRPRSALVAPAAATILF